MFDRCRAERLTDRAAAAAECVRDAIAAAAGSASSIDRGEAGRIVGRGENGGFKRNLVKRWRRML
jgi:hypothetical protein